MLVLWVAIRLLALTSYVAIMFWASVIELLVLGTPNVTIWLTFLTGLWLTALVIHRQVTSELTHGFRVVATGYLVIEIAFVSLDLTGARVMDPTVALGYAIGFTLLSLLFVHYTGSTIRALEDRIALEEQVLAD